MEQQTHFFIAVKIPNETKLMMKTHCENLKETLPFQRWVHHEDLHITLAFLGNAPAEKLKNAEKNVRDALNGSSALNLQINKLGIFGHEKSPRIFYADTVESKELQLIRKKVFKACDAAGFQLETRAFRPHITLGRKWGGDSPFQLEMLQMWADIQPKPLIFQATEVVLYQTHLQKTPKYEEKIVFPLDCVKGHCW